MATTIKVLGQQAPPATTLTTLYTVPVDTSTVCSTISVCNRGNTETSYRVAIRVNGEALDNKQYMLYDNILAGNDTYMATIGITLSTGDIVSVYAGNANLSFQLFGQEKT